MKIYLISWVLAVITMIFVAVMWKNLPPQETNPSLVLINVVTLIALALALISQPPWFFFLAIIFVLLPNAPGDTVSNSCRQKIFFVIAGVYFILMFTSLGLFLLN